MAPVPAPPAPRLVWVPQSGHWLVQSIREGAALREVLVKVA
jgi:hypothetical protein